VRLGYRSVARPLEVLEEGSREAGDDELLAGGVAIEVADVGGRLEQQSADAQRAGAMSGGEAEAGRVGSASAGAGR
jgi:hypothetical protein